MEEIFPQLQVESFHREDGKSDYSPTTNNGRCDLEHIHIDRKEAPAGIKSL